MTCSMDGGHGASLLHWAATDMKGTGYGRHRDHGLKGISPKRQPGCPSKLPVAQQQSLQERLLAGPTETDGVCTLRAKTSGEFSRRNSGPSIAWRECMICCIVWAFPAWPHAPVTARTIRPPCSNGSNKPPFCPGHAQQHPGQYRGLVPGRSPSRPAGNPDPLLGPDRLASDGRKADRV